MTTLPTLILGWGSHHRDVNTQDNEQRVPDIAWADFPRRFGLRRTFSANEIDYFDENSGKRSPFSRSSSSLHLKILEGAKRERELKRPERLLGISDEYVPGLMEFNPMKFGVLPPLAAVEMEHAGSKHAIAQPIAIEAPKAPQNGILVTDEMFSIARSPERDADRIVLSSLPKQFQSLSFSERKRILSEIIPSSLRDDPSYKDHLSKIIRRNTSNATSPNVSRRGSVISRKSSLAKIAVEPDVNQMGSTVLSEWVLGKVVNRGAFGVIRECKHCEATGDVRCFKLVHIKRSVPYLQRLRRELVTWAHLTEMDAQEGTKCVVPLQDFKITKDYVFMQMPLCNEGSLFDKVKVWESSRVTLRSRIKLVMRYICAAARAIAFIHRHGLYHGDIKLENFILVDDVPLVCDFGMADFIDKADEFGANSELLSKIHNQCQTIVGELSLARSTFGQTGSAPNFSSMRMGSPFKQLAMAGSSNRLAELSEPKLPDELIGSLPYASPELLQPAPKGIDTPCDVWAFGVMCYVLVTFKLPFLHTFEPRMKLSIMEGHWRTEEWDQAIGSVDTGSEIQRDMARAIDVVVTGCLQTDIPKRLTMRQVLEKLQAFANV